MKGKASTKKKTKSSRRKNRVFNEEFKLKAVERMQAGERVRRLSEELGVRRGVLYRWRDAYRKDGRAGLCRTAGRPAQSAAARQAEAEISAARRIAELERLVGRQAVDLDFFEQAFRRVEELRRTSTNAGATASTERSEP